MTDGDPAATRSIGPFEALAWLVWAALPPIDLVVHRSTWTMDAPAFAVGLEWLQHLGLWALAGLVLWIVVRSTCGPSPLRLAAPVVAIAASLLGWIVADRWTGPFWNMPARAAEAWIEYAERDRLDGQQLVAIDHDDWATGTGFFARAVHVRPDGTGLLVLDDTDVLVAPKAQHHDAADPSSARVRYSCPAAEGWWYVFRSAPVPHRTR